MAYSFADRQSTELLSNVFKKEMCGRPQSAGPIARDQKFMVSPADAISFGNSSVTRKLGGALLDRLADRLATVRNRTQAPHLAIRLRNCYGDRLCMDIQTQKS
jgi:hypothetical protein